MHHIICVELLKCKCCLTYHNEGEISVATSEAHRATLLTVVRHTHQHEKYEVINRQNQWYKHSHSAVITVLENDGTHSLILACIPVEPSSILLTP